MKLQLRLRFRIAAALALALTLTAGSATAMTNGTPPAADDWRFDAVGAFAVSWRLGFDQGSHADDADHAWFCTATLVNASQIVVAKHCLTPYGTGPGATYMVRFRRALDGSLGSVGVGVSSFYHARVAYGSWWQHPTVDLAIGTLEEPVSHITAIPLSDESLDPNDMTIQTESPVRIIHAGWGKEGPAFGAGTSTRLLTCDNTIYSLDSEYITHPTPYQAPLNSCGPNVWDSGGAVVRADACGNLRVVGVQTFSQVATRVTTSAVDQAPPDVFYRCLDAAISPSGRWGRFHTRPIG